MFKDMPATDKVSGIAAEGLGINLGDNGYCRFFGVVNCFVRVIGGVKTEHAVIAEALEYFQEISLAASDFNNVLVVQLILPDEPLGCVPGPLSEIL